MAEYNPSKIIKDGNTYNFRDTTKIPLAGSSQISGSLIPATDGTVNLGSPSYQWNYAYIKSLTINGVACGDILTHNVSEFVNVTGNQTIGGRKTFTHLDFILKSDVIDNTVTPATNLFRNLHVTDKNNVRLGSLYYAQRTNDDRELNLRVYNPNGGEPLNFNLIYTGNARNAVFHGDSFVPNSTNSTDLGTSTNKWKTLNGINPGALSLPSTSTGYVDIKSTVGQYLKDNNTNIYEFTAPFDGWICVGIVKGSLRVDNYTMDIGNGSENLGYWHSYSIPFRKDDVIQIKINKMNATDDYVTDIMWKAHIYPCQGNV